MSDDRLELIDEFLQELTEHFHRYGFGLNHDGKLYLTHYEERGHTFSVTSNGRILFS